MKAPDGPDHENEKGFAPSRSSSIVFETSARQDQQSCTLMTCQELERLDVRSERNDSFTSKAII